jgi:hypothetical protein
MPFIDDYDALIAAGHEHNEIVKISAGRCARVSYLNHDNVRAPKDDIALAERLAGQNPGHWSPFEHVAMAQNDRERNRNFRGFTQLRAVLEQSSVEV